MKLPLHRALIPIALLFANTFLLSCSDPHAGTGGSATDIDAMVGTVVDLSGNPQQGITAYCYGPDYLPYNSDSVKYESITPSDAEGSYTFRNFNVTEGYNILTVDADTNLAGFRQVTTADYDFEDTFSGIIRGEDTVRNVESCLPGITILTEVPAVMQVKGTPFYTRYDTETKKFDKVIPFGRYDFHLSFPDNPELGVFEYDNVAVPFGEVTLVVPDTTPPSPIGPADLVEQTHSTLAYDWEPCWDNSSLAGYEVTYFPVGKPEEVETLFTGYSQIRIENLQEGTTYELQGRTVDLFSNKSAWTAPVHETTSGKIDDLGPIIETAWVDFASRTAFTVKWSAGIDLSPITGYEVTYGETAQFEETKVVSITETQEGVDPYRKVIENLSPDTHYSVYILGIDKYENMSKDTVKVYVKTYK